MSSDRSRRTDRARHGYTGIAAQQGRVILDRDFNALQGLVSDRREAEAVDVIGPCGTPDDGFRISLPDDGGSPPHLYSPPFSPPASPPYTVGGPGDLLISPGTMYIGVSALFFLRGRTACRSATATTTSRTGRRRMCRTDRRIGKSVPGGNWFTWT